MDNNESSFHEIASNQSAYTIRDCLEAIQNGFIPDSSSSKLLVECLRSLHDGRRPTEQSQLDYIIQSAIQDGFLNEEADTDNSVVFLQWAIEHLESEEDENSYRDDWW